jgi:hypothetical protein
LKRKPYKFIKFLRMSTWKTVTAVTLKMLCCFKHGKRKPSIHLMSLFILYFTRHLNVEIISGRISGLHRIFSRQNQ